MSYKKYATILKNAEEQEQLKAEELFREIYNKVNSFEKIKQETRKKIEEIGQQGAKPLTRHGEPLNNHEIVMYLEGNLDPQQSGTFVSLLTNELTNELRKFGSLPNRLETEWLSEGTSRDPVDPIVLAYAKQYWHFIDQIWNLSYEKMWQIRGKILAHPKKFFENLMEKAKKDLDDEL